MENYIKDYLVINSEDRFFTFNLSSKNTLSYKIYSNKFNIIDENILKIRDVLKYSIALDNENNIHILYLLKSGTLYLQTYDNKVWKESIVGKFDLKSNKYYQLELFFINSKFHIICGYSNLINPNICTIEHIIYKESIEQRHDVIRYASIKKKPDFSVDYDSSGAIHILYNTTTNTKSYIYHCFYSPYRKSWSNNPKSLWEGLNNGFSYIFIDKMKSIHSLWLKKSNTNYGLSYKKMDTTGQNQYTWRDISVDNMYIPKDTPFTLYEKDKILYISFIVDRTINIFKSQDYGISWVNESQIKYTNISRIKTLVNKNLYPNFKIKHLLDDFTDISNCKSLKKLFPNFKSNSKGAEPLYVKNNKDLNMENKDTDDLEKIIEDLFISKASENDKSEEVLKDIFINNISNYGELDFEHIKDDLNKSVEENIKTEDSLEQLNLEIKDIKSQIQQILNSQLSLEKKINILLDKGDSFEEEILKIKEEIKELPVPMLKKLFK